MTDERERLRRTAEIAADFLESLETRPVWPHTTVEELRLTLGWPLPDEPGDPLDVIETLARAAEEGVVGIPSGRYFGLVIGGAVPPRSLPTGSRPPGIRMPASTPVARRQRSSRRS